MSAQVGVGPYTSRRFGVCQIQGRTLIDFTSWDVFELGRSRSVIDAVHRELELEGVGGCSTRILGGYSPALHSAETKWASLLGVERAALVSSRNQALFSMMTQRLTGGDEILMFVGGSAPIAELAELCGATFIPVSWTGLAKTLRELGPKRPGIARFFFLEVGHPLLQAEIDYPELVDMLGVEGVELIVDETLSLGILGGAGGGLFDLIGRPYSGQVGIAGLDAIVGIPSLAIIYGRGKVVDDVVKSSSVLKSEPPPTPMIAAASEAACRQIQLLGIQRIELADRVLGFRDMIFKLSGLGGVIHNSCCLTVKLPSFKAGLEFQRGLIREGYLCGVSQTTLERDPSCLVQFVVSIFHSDQVLQSLAQVIARVMRAEAVE